MTVTLTITGGTAAGSFNVSTLNDDGRCQQHCALHSQRQQRHSTLTSMSPSSGMPGSSVNVTVTGTNLTPPSGVRLSGLGPLFNNIVLVSSTQITVTFKLSPTTATGGHNVFVVTSAGNSKHSVVYGTERSALERDRDQDSGSFGFGRDS